MKEYFSHDYNTRADDKIIDLLRKEKLEGYGIYWCIVEMIYTANGKLRQDYELIAFELRAQCERIKAVVEDFGLFYIEDNFICSESIDRRLAERENRTFTARNSAMKRWGYNAKAMPMQCNGNAIRDSKGKERKEKKEGSMGFRPPTQLEVIQYCGERGNIVNPAKWFSHYESNGWLVGKNKMKDWKAAIRTWEHSEYGNTTPKPQQGPIPARINPFDEVDKEMKLTKELEDFHSKHTSGGTCSFCGAKSNGVKFWTCNCAEYQSAIKEIRGKYYAKR